jgi:hypothetical protein
MHPVAAPASSKLGQEYRLPRSYFRLGVVGASFFSLAGVTSVWMALANFDGSFARPVAAAVVFGTFWGALTLLGLYLVRAALVERLVVWEDRVRVVGSFRTREVKFNEVERAKWRRIGNPGGSLVLYAGTVRLVVYFANYGDHGPRLRDFFRAAIPVERQERWDVFSETFVPTPEKVEQGRRRAKWGFAVFAVFGAVLLGVGIADPLNDPAWRWQSIIFGGLTVAFGAYAFARASRPAAPPTAEPDGPAPAPDRPWARH